MEQIPEPGIWQTLSVLLQTLGTLFVQLAGFGFHWVLWIVWAAWWLGGVNARKARYVLSQGSWAPAVLIVIVSALVWSRIEPSSIRFLGIFTLANFWWQLGYVAMLAGTAMFCGWLQDVFHWTPPEVDFNPPAHAHHGHGDHHGHAHEEIPADIPSHAPAPAHH